MSQIVNNEFESLDWSKVRNLKIQGRTVKITFDDFQERDFTFDTGQEAAEAFLKWVRSQDPNEVLQNRLAQRRGEAPGNGKQQAK